MNEYLQKKTKETVLDESTWLKSMEKIIQRDFYPDIPLMTAQIEYYEAMRSKDPSLIEIAQQKIDKTSNNTIAPLNQRKVTLDEFLSTYTSEDNASFGVILETMKLKHRERWSKYFSGGVEKTNDPNVKLLTNGSAPIGLIEDSKPNKKNALFFYSEHISRSENVGRPLPEKRIAYENLKYVEPILETNFKRKEEDYWNSDTPHEYLLEGSETPVINGFRMIRDPPKVARWSSTVIDDVSDAPSFRIPQTPQREVKAQELCDKATLKLNKTPVNRMQSPVQRILSGKKKDSFGDSLRSSYSPVIKTVTPKRQNSQESPVPKRVKSEKDGDSVTDDLLKL